MFLCSVFHYPIFNIYKYTYQIITEIATSNHTFFYTFFNALSLMALSLMFSKFILAPLQSFY